ncbi:hypothetical protein N7448_010955 [Penicillium atrosanguineum]|nr:hypothetical protein N7448_010955 [Penicillium atrosanguineum]
MAFFNALKESTFRRIKIVFLTDVFIVRRCVDVSARSPCSIFLNKMFPGLWKQSLNDPTIKGDV